MSAPDFNNFAPLYDFSLVEKAVQSFFCADSLAAGFIAPKDDDDPSREQWSPAGNGIAFYTAFQALTFQKCRPRVWVNLNNIREHALSKTIDVNGVFRGQAWDALMHFGIVTDPGYVLHTALRTRVLAIIPQIQPLPTPDGSAIATSGLNAILQYHELARAELSDLTTAIHIEEGNYRSDINLNITFSVRASQWPVNNP